MSQIPSPLSPFSFFSDSADLNVTQDIEQRRKITGRAVLGKLQETMTGDAAPAEKMKYLLFNAPVEIRDLCNEANLPLWSLSSALPKQENEQMEESSSDWRKVMDQYALHGGNEQGKLERAVPVLQNGGDVVMRLAERWSGSNMMRSPVLPCQITPQDGGILVRHDCDIVFTPPLSGCAFFTCRVGGEQKMFHVNRPYDFRRMIPVAVHLWAPLSAAERRELGPKIDVLFHKFYEAEADRLVQMEKDLSGLAKESFPESDNMKKQITGNRNALEGIMNSIPSTFLQCTQAWRKPGEQCWSVVQLAFVLSCESNLQSLAAVSPPYGTAMSVDGTNIFQTLPVALRENGGFTLYMCPQITHRPSSAESFSIIRKGDPQAVNFTPPDFVMAFRDLYDRAMGNVPVFDPNAILV